MIYDSYNFIALKKRDLIAKNPEKKCHTLPCISMLSLSINKNRSWSSSWLVKDAFGCQRKVSEDWILCFEFSLNLERIYLTRYIDGKITKVKSRVILDNLKTYTAYSPRDWSIISILKPSFDMALFQYFWRFTRNLQHMNAKLFLLLFLNNFRQNCSEKITKTIFWSYLCKSVQIFRNTGTMPCQMMTQVSK